MTSDFLAELDAAVEQRCACLCGRAITASSPSAYYASETCASTWHHQRRHPVGHIDREALAALLRRMWAPIARQVHAVVDALLAAFRRLREQLQPLLKHLVEPPTDPRERALWARRTRGTGPHPRVRAPRTLAPSAGFTSAARGRRARRPALR